MLGDVIFGGLTGLVPTWHWLLLIRTVNGAVTAAATLLAEALLIDKVPAHRRGEAVGFVAPCAIIDRNVGPAFGGSTQFVASQFLDVISSYRARASSISKEKDWKEQSSIEALFSATRNWRSPLS